VYEGRYHQDQRANAIGVMKYKNGDNYSGAWVSEKKCGYGDMRYSNGDNYEGHWVDDMKHGEGNMMYSTGDQYGGMWKHDRRDESNLESMFVIHKSGNTYRGNCLKMMYHGQGKMNYKNGDVYVGEWQMDEKSGQGTMKFASGDVFEGRWEHDNMHGTGRYKYSNGSEFQGEFKYGIRHGERGRMVICDEVRLNVEVGSEAFNATSMAHSEAMKGPPKGSRPMTAGPDGRLVPVGSSAYAESRAAKKAASVPIQLMIDGFDQQDQLPESDGQFESDGTTQWSGYGNDGRRRR
jgi:hypothetical protein